MQVLVAEDEAKVAAAIAASLRKSGLAVDIAGNGEDAWYLAGTRDYAAIVLDLGLPKLDGFSVLKRLREDGMAAPILVLSARGSWAERVAGINAGADDYLPKPFVSEELVARVHGLIRRSAGTVAKQAGRTADRSGPGDRHRHRAGQKDRPHADGVPAAPASDDQCRKGGFRFRSGRGTLFPSP